MAIDWDLSLDLGELDARIDAAIPEALRMGMEHIGEVSAQQVPIEEGTLLRSQTIVVDGDTASISYAGPYARYQHEKLKLRHEHGNAKYLELPVITEAGTAVEIVGEQIRRAL